MWKGIPIQGFSVNMLLCHNKYCLELNLPKYLFTKTYIKCMQVNVGNIYKNACNTIKWPITTVHLHVKIYLLSFIVKYKHRNLFLLKRKPAAWTTKSILTEYL